MLEKHRDPVVRLVGRPQELQRGGAVDAWDERCATHGAVHAAIPPSGTATGAGVSSTNRSAAMSQAVTLATSVTRLRPLTRAMWTTRWTANAIASRTLRCGRPTLAVSTQWARRVNACSAEFA